jgi:hypothetical protein
MVISLVSNETGRETGKAKRIKEKICLSCVMPFHVILSFTRLGGRTLEEENRKKKKDRSTVCRTMLELQGQESKKASQHLLHQHAIREPTPVSLHILTPHNIPTPPPLSPNHLLPTSGPKSVLLSSLTTSTSSSTLPLSNSPNSLITRT